MQGPAWIQLAGVIGSAVFAWSQSPSNLSLQGVTTGVAGGGFVTGTIFVRPIPLPVSASLDAAGLVGVDAALIGQAVGIGVATTFSASATYQGTSAGVGSGTDVSRISVANGPALVLALNAAAATAGLRGVSVPRISTGLGPGIAALLLTGTGTGVVSGPSGPAPAVGTSISRVF